LNGKKARLARKIFSTEYAKYKNQLKNKSIKNRIKDFLRNFYSKLKYYIKYFYNTQFKGLVYRTTRRNIMGVYRKIKQNIKKRKETPCYSSERHFKKRKRKKK